MDKKANLLLDKIKCRFIQILGDDLVGIYVHGSIAFECFRWEHSDIDLIVVVKTSLKLEAKRDILELLWRLREEVPPEGIEMSIVLEEHCKSFVYPTPYELHWSKCWMEQYVKNPNVLCDTKGKADFDLAAHFTVIQSVGVELYGRCIKDVFGMVKPKYYFDSIYRDVSSCMDEVEENPVYVILNLCRVVAYLKDGLVLSKLQGGSWGMENLPIIHKKVICAAQNIYNGVADSINSADAKKFCEYSLGEIGKFIEKVVE